MNVCKRITLTCLSLLVLGLVPFGAAFAQVRVTAAMPSSAYQGTISLDVIVSGSGFDNSAKVQYFLSGTTNPGGITVKKVAFHNSQELVTTLDVADAAVLANFDIQVTLSDGRKGKGTTLFAVKAVPIYPAATFWQAFTSNGGDTVAASRLYMFGGSTVVSSGPIDLNDLWSYASAGSTGATWTFIRPGKFSPGPRHHVGWSCGGGRCVTSNGGYVGPLKETWVFTESNSSWSQVNCSGRRVVCPSARLHPTMAYDPLHLTHVLFGGSKGGVAFNDTFTFSPDAMTWANNGISSVVPARSRAAAKFVPALGRIVMFGGQQENVRALNDMYSWSGSAWAPVLQVVDATLSAVPSLHSHSIAWDPTLSRLVVTGGLVDVSDTPNTATFYVTFSSVGGAWKANWTLASGIGCQSAAGSPPDPDVHPEARVAFDIPSGVQVFYGGVENVGGSVFAYGNTVQCR